MNSIEAKYFEKKENNNVRCNLCPHLCLIEPGGYGKCNVRKNVEGTLMAETYERASSVGMDPVRKKPLYHFYPNKMVLSVGSIGCNLSCAFCQNHGISQILPGEGKMMPQRSVESIIAEAKGINNNLGIAFTYNEPTVWYEFMYDIARKAKQENLKTMMISNGFINNKPLEDLLPYMDAFNIDLKAFNNEFYKRLSGGSLPPVLESMKLIHQHRKHLEVTNLIIPGENDDPAEFENMVHWIRTELGKNTVLHISRYFPVYRMNVPPTPKETIYEFKEIAQKYLDNVYLGNI
ncbi:MAG: AmmeMemoRadiSam system radical SAM enzyme [Bacteroidales bacterium]|nr:AmmeMemoRadiSam system radical SAM enzyme [Bacteroidales bacterium]MCF8327275.1 AmmeMemoRadiSam system radical SAM enzyme [Bacteroidales bacterium]